MKLKSEEARNEAKETYDRALRGELEPFKIYPTRLLMLKAFADGLSIPKIAEIFDRNTTSIRSEVESILRKNKRSKKEYWVRDREQTKQYLSELSILINNAILAEQCRSGCVPMSRDSSSQN